MLQCSLFPKGVLEKCYIDQKQGIRIWGSEFGDQ